MDALGGITSGEGSGLGALNRVILTIMRRGGVFGNLADDSLSCFRRMAFDVAKKEKAHFLPEERPHDGLDKHVSGDSKLCAKKEKGVEFAKKGVTGSPADEPVVDDEW